MVTLGQKLKIFRQDTGISQFDLEIELGLGNGSISRIESDQIIPKRESVLRIANFLKLNERQIDYLIGSRTVAATEEEIADVIKRTSDVWNLTDAFVILHDDHFRVCAATLGIKGLFGVSDEAWSQYINLRNMVSIVLNPNLPFLNSFTDEKDPQAETALESILLDYYYLMEKATAEEDYIQTVAEINNNPLAKIIWEKITNNKENKLFLLIKDKILTFEVEGKKIDLAFYTETIPYSSRFSYIEFFPIQA